MTFVCLFLDSDLILFTQFIMNEPGQHSCACVCVCEQIDQTKLAAARVNDDNSGGGGGGRRLNCL